MVAVSVKSLRVGAWCASIRADELRRLAATQDDPIERASLLNFAVEIESAIREFSDAVNGGKVG